MTILEALKPYIELMPPVAGVYRRVRDALQFFFKVNRLAPEGVWLKADRRVQDGRYEAAERIMLATMLGDADTFVDVGANVGLYACIACKAGKKVIAVEPHATNVKYLLWNLIQNDFTEAEVYPVALDANIGVRKLYGAGTGASFIRAWSGASVSVSQYVSTLTLDGILGERALGRMLIKIDVEGTEREVLAGATKTLLRSPQPLWFVEINFDDHYPSGSNPYFLETFEVFWKSGYSCHRADDLKETVSPERVKRWLSSGTQDRSGHNYLFVPCKM